MSTYIKLQSIQSQLNWLTKKVKWLIDSKNKFPTLNVVDADNPTYEEAADIPCNGIFKSNELGTNVVNVWMKDCLTEQLIQLN